MKYPANHSPNFAEMLKLAQQVLQHSYSPYSKFSVGACLLANNNKMYTGTNVENASFGLTTCAESNAVSAMVADGATQIKEIVIIAKSSEFCTPCGACRQRLREFSRGDALVHMCNDKADALTMTLEQLLPKSFGPEFLGK